jgi:hypothetical protein
LGGKPAPAGENNHKVGEVAPTNRTNQHGWKKTKAESGKAEMEKRGVFDRRGAEGTEKGGAGDDGGFLTAKYATHANEGGDWPRMTSGFIKRALDRLFGGGGVHGMRWIDGQKKPAGQARPVFLRNALQRACPTGEQQAC